MDALATVLDKVDLGWDQGVARGDLELQLDQLVVVDGVVRADEVAKKAEHVVFVEEAHIWKGHVRVVPRPGPLLDSAEATHSQSSPSRELCAPSTCASTGFQRPWGRAMGRWATSWPVRVGGNGNKW